MSKTPLALIAAALGVAFLSGAAAAQSAAGPFAGADCREARLNQVVGGRVTSSEPVIICKPRRVDQVTFNPAPSDRECAMLSCPTFVLTGIGD